MPFWSVPGDIPVTMVNSNNVQNIQSALHLCNCRSIIFSLTSPFYLEHFLSSSWTVGFVKVPINLLYQRNKTCALILMCFYICHAMRHLSGLTVALFKGKVVHFGKRGR